MMSAVQLVAETCAQVCGDKLHHLTVNTAAIEAFALTLDLAAVTAGPPRDDRSAAVHCTRLRLHVHSQALAARPRVQPPAPARACERLGGGCCVCVPGAFPSRVCASRPVQTMVATQPATSAPV